MSAYAAITTALIPVGSGRRGESGGSAGIRTRDLSIKSRLLYRLSYGPAPFFEGSGPLAWPFPDRQPIIETLFRNIVRLPRHRGAVSPAGPAFAGPCDGCADAASRATRQPAVQARNAVFPSHNAAGAIPACTIPIVRQGSHPDPARGLPSAVYVGGRTGALSACTAPAIPSVCHAIDPAPRHWRTGGPMGRAAGCHGSVPGRSVRNRPRPAPVSRRAESLRGGQSGRGSGWNQARPQHAIPPHRTWR